MNDKFDKVIAGEWQPLSESELLEFKVYCSRLGLPLDKWDSIALTLYRRDPQQCLELLLYVEKHELNKPVYRDFSNQNIKIALYDNLAALHLGRAIRSETKEEGDKLLTEAKKYTNLAEKVRQLAGRVHIALTGFILFYEGNFQQALSRFNMPVEKNSQDEGQSVVGVLGLAQLSFAKRNYQAALGHYKKALRMNKSLPTKARLGMAYCFYELEKYELAKACFKRIMDLQPTCIEAKLGYATLWFNEGYPDIYFETLEQCYQQAPNHPEVLLHLSEHMLLSQNVGKLPAICQKALELLKRLPVFADKNGQYRNDVVEYRCRFNHLLGQLYHQQNEHETCVRHYNLALHPNLLFVHVNLAQAYTNPAIPMYEDAIKLLDTVQRTIPQKHRRLLSETYRLQGYVKSKSMRQQAIETYNDAVKYNPHDFESLIEFGNLLLDSDAKRCLQLYQLAESVLKERNEQPQPELYNNLAVMAIITENYPLASQYIDRAFKQMEVWRHTSHDEEHIKEVKEKGLLALLHFNKAILLEQTCRYDGCLQEYQNVLQINPFLADVYVRQALFYHRRGNSRKALEICEAGSKAVGQCKIVAREVYSLDMIRAYIHKAANDERSARQALTKYRERDSYAKVFDDSLEFDALMQKTDSNTLNIKSILKEKAVNVLKMCEIERHNVYEFMILAAMLAEIGKTQESLECFNNIKQFDEQHPQIMYNLAILYYKMERFDDAVMTLRRYIEKVGRTDDIRAELSLAIVLFTQGKSHDAIKVVKKLILVHPDSIILRYNLNLFLQRSSEIILDSKTKQTKRTQMSIAYLKRCFTLFNYLSRLNIGAHLSSIDNHEAKDKLKLELGLIAEKSEDQKLYIKSREERFTAYERQAEAKQSATNEQARKTLANVRERCQQRRRQEQEQANQKAREAEQRRRARIAEQKRIEEEMNSNLQNQLMEKQIQQNAGKKAPRTKKPRKSHMVMEEEHQEHPARSPIHDQDIIPVDVATNKQRYNKLIRRQKSQQSSEEHYEVGNRLVANALEATGQQPATEMVAAPAAKSDSDEL